MANYGPDDVVLLVGGYDLSGRTFEIGPIDTERVLEMTRGFGDSWDEHTPVGIHRGSVSHRSWYDDAALATDAALVGALTTEKWLGATIEGNALGKNAVAFKVAQRNVARLPMRDELTKIAAEYHADGRIDDVAKLLQPFQAETSTSGGTSPGGLDNGAGSSSGGRAYLFVNSLTLGGYTSLTINLQESTDNGGGDPYATKQVLVAGLTTAPHSNMIPISGTIERWTRINLAWAGAGSGQSVTLMVILVRD